MRFCTVSPYVIHLKEAFKKGDNKQTVQQSERLCLLQQINKYGKLLGIPGVP